MRSSLRLRSRNQCIKRLRYSHLIGCIAHTTNAAHIHKANTPPPSHSSLTFAHHSINTHHDQSQQNKRQLRRRASPRQPALKAKAHLRDHARRASHPRIRPHRVPQCPSFCSPTHLTPPRPPHLHRNAHLHRRAPPTHRIPRRRGPNLSCFRAQALLPASTTRRV